LSNKRLETLCNLASESHVRIQKDFAEINPMVGINHKMRDLGVPADVVTIDHSKSNRRIILVLHDHYPEVVNVQFSFKDTDPDDAFEQHPFSELSTDTLYDWIRGYFQAGTHSPAPTR